ncbi:MAG: YbaY family lipoprotein [Roseiflexaceae bacterium]
MYAFRITSRTLLIALLAGVFSVLITAPALAQGNASVTGEVLYRERIALPPSARVIIQLQDVSFADAAATVLAEQTIDSDGKGPPFAFELAYDAAKIDSRFSYAVRAQIKDGDTLLFATTERYAVLTQGNPSSGIQIVVHQVSAAPQTASLPKELLSRDWKLLELQRAPGNTQSTIGANVTIRFSADGKVSGSAGCNSFGGSYTVGANRSVQFSQLISTLKACASPSVNTFEQEYLSALQSASSYILDSQSRFQLIYNNAQGRLSYSAPTLQEQLCFTETSYCISGRFLSYWRQNGGLAVFGLPIGDQTTENNLPVQYFERQRFELHAENPAPYDVLLGRLGDELLRQRSIDWSTLPKEAGAQAGCRYFPETQHSVCDQVGGSGFLSYWSANGLEFDRARGKSSAESLALFGLPLTEPMTMTLEGQPFLVQWFERARFEWHPDNTAAYRVLLGRLGVEVQSPPLDQTPVAPPALSPADITLTNSDDGKAIGLKSGQILAVRLDSNPSTGYSWQVGQVNDAVLKQQGEPQFIQPADAPPGAGGAQVFVFNAAAGGTSTLTLVYKRSFEPDVAPIQTFTVQVTVDASAASVGAPQT